jgi:hypothetical protein
MTLLDTLRDRVRTGLEPGPSGDGRHDPDADPSPWWQAPVAGALAAATSWLLLALAALVVWVATAHTTVGWLQALGVAGAGWFLGHSGTVQVDTVSLSLTPLGVTLGALLVTVRRARRLLDTTERTAVGTTWPGLLVRRLVPGFLAGYAAFAAVAWLLTLAGPARPHPLGVLVVLGVPVAALAWLLLGRYVDGAPAGPVTRKLDRLPRWLPRAVRPGAQGVVLLLGLGMLLVAVMVVVRWSTVAGVHAAVGADVLGAVVLTAGQLLVLPNLAVWGLSFVSGPGFQIADGSSITLTGAHPGLMPLVPVLGALPTNGAWSPWLVLLLAGPVAAGAAVAWWAVRPLARLASWRTKLLVAVTAVVTSALLTTLLARLGSGSVGVDRLRDVGVQPVLLGAALLCELLAGAGAYVLVAQLRLRFRHR